MPLRTEIFHALYGAWRLLLTDASGMKWFNQSITGFWRSFLAGAIVAPIYFLSLGLGDNGSATPDGFLVVRTLQYLAGWIAFPVIMMIATVLMEWTDRYIGYVIAYNWSSVIMIAAMMPVTLLSEAMRTSSPGWNLADAAYYIVFMFTLFYSWFVAVTALRIGAMTGIAIMLLDLIVGFAIGVGGHQLLASEAETLPYSNGG
jgi:hypothetical protein